MGKPRQRLLYVYASLSRLEFQSFFENAILVFLGITDFPPSKKPTYLMMGFQEQPPDFLRLAGYRGKYPGR